MIASKVMSLILVLGASSAFAASLPIKPGTYVLSSTSCRDPAFASTFAYDGHQFSYPHATKCQSRIRSHSGLTYRVVETCSALGDGSPAAATTVETAYVIRSATVVRVFRGSAGTGSSFRWCPPPAAKKG